MLRLDWNSEVKIEQVKCPLLIVAGQVDKLCPMHMSMSLHDAAVNAKFRRMFIVPGGDHNTTFLLAGAQYYIKLEEFICECLGETPRSRNLTASQEEADTVEADPVLAESLELPSTDVTEDNRKEIKPSMVHIEDQESDKEEDGDGAQAVVNDDKKAPSDDG